MKIADELYTSDDVIIQELRSRILPMYVSNFIRELNAIREIINDMETPEVKLISRMIFLRYLAAEMEKLGFNAKYTQPHIEKLLGRWHLYLKIKRYCDKLLNI